VPTAEGVGLRIERRLRALVTDQYLYNCLQNVLRTPQKDRPNVLD
jgi:hypothetical protein